MKPYQFAGFRACIALLVATLAGPAFAAEENPIRENYTKFEYKVPMRDGVKLFTSVYIPNDRSQDYPILLSRTPYSVRPYGADQYRDELGPVAEFAEELFIFVYQDVRGRYMSEGEFVNMRPHVASKVSSSDIDESSDTYDTIEWLLKNLDHHNGRVGLWGLSYGGFYASAGMIDSHPALVATSPQAPIADWFWDDMHHHGAFILPLAFNFFSTFGKARPEPTTKRPEFFDHGTPDGYRFFLDLGPLGNANEHYLNGEIAFWNQIIEHPNYDSFWQSRNILPHLENISCAVMTVGGWFDTEDLYGPLRTYRSIEDQNPGIPNTIVMGPWSHGGWLRGEGTSLGDAQFGSKTSERFREYALLPFFKHHLKGDGVLELPEAWAFETGANRWRSFDEWPPSAVELADLYLGPEGTLTSEPASEGADASDEYPSDPAKPIPYTEEITARWARDYMTEDQRFAARRPDVLVYRGPILEDDVTLAGPITADLWVSTTGEDSDWVVKIIDEFPPSVPDVDEDGEEIDRGGTQRLVRAEVFRGRFRKDYEQPEPFVPNQVERVSFFLNDILHTFQRGHRIMIQIQSSWFPFVDRNPQSWVPNIFQASEEDFIKVTNRIHRSSAHPSRIVVGVIDGTPLNR